MDANRAETTDAAILAEQLAYYRARAAEYDEWWLRTGRYDHGAELNAAWHADAAQVEQALVAHLDAARPQSALELADLFAWQPTARYDFVFMSFWLSHVPDDRFDEFWTKVRRALADGGSAYVIDSGWDTTSSATNHARPERERGVAVRKLNDGREYRIVKVFHDPAELARRLAALGLASRVAHTPRYFIHGAVTRHQRESS